MNAKLVTVSDNVANYARNVLEEQLRKIMRMRCALTHSYLQEDGKPSLKGISIIYTSLILIFLAP